MGIGVKREHSQSDWYYGPTDSRFENRLKTPGCDYRINEI